MPHSRWDNRHWVIIPVTELDNVDFSQVCETSIDTVRKSVDETRRHLLNGMGLRCPLP